MTMGKFVPGDARLDDFRLNQIVRTVIPSAVTSGVLTADDIKFLMLWDSGTYFQTAPVPVLFPFDANVSDIAESTCTNYRVHYYDDIEISYCGAKYRLLEIRGERALPVLLNWLKDRGITDEELKLEFAISARDYGDASGRKPIDLTMGTKPLEVKVNVKCKSHQKAYKKGSYE